MCPSERTYLITFATYGSHLPGQPGSVPITQNIRGTPLPEPDRVKEHNARHRMAQPVYVIDTACAAVILRAIQEVCRFRAWGLVAAHVRTSHVRVIVTAGSAPEHVMNALKSYASRALNAGSSDESGCRRWARHGSTRCLWTPDAIRNAIRYVVDEQGEPMAVFVSPDMR